MKYFEVVVQDKQAKYLFGGQIIQPGTRSAENLVLNER